MKRQNSFLDKINWFLNETARLLEQTWRITWLLKQLLKLLNNW